MLTNHNITISILKALGFMSRLVIIVIISGCLFTNLIYADDAIAQKLGEVEISVDIKDADLESLLHYVEEETDFDFVYSLSLIQDQKRKLSYHFEKILVFDLLSKISEDTGLWFLQINSSIAINAENIWENQSEGVLICPGECVSPKRRRNENGILKGVIIDELTREPIIGATIVLNGTSIGEATDTDGSFVIRRIPTGTQQFIIRYLGYKTKELTYEIRAEEETEVTIELRPDVYEGEGVVVYSQAEGQAEAIRSQISSTSLINVVSESRIRELPDANAAESVGRLPGVSVIRDSGEGQLIAIRGLAPRHNSITIDGDRIPSSDESGRSVNLSVISPEMLSGIEVFKAIRPDMDADAIGGSVNFKFAGVPSGRTFRTNLSTGYSNHIENFGAYNLTVNGSQRFFNEKLGVLASVDLERKDRSSDSFNASYLVLRDAREGEEYALIGVNGITLSDKSIVRDRLGTGVIVDFRLPKNGLIMFNNFASILDQETLNRTRRYDIGSNSQNYGITDSESETAVMSSRISGEHTFLGSKIEWKVSRNLSRQDVPYDHSISFEEPGAFIASELDETEGPLAVTEAAVNNIENTHFNGSNFETALYREEDYAAQSDVTIPIRIGNQVDGEFKFGGKYVTKERLRTGREWAIRSGDGDFITNNEERDWIYTGSGRISILNYLNNSYQPSEFLDGNYSFPIQINKDEIRDLWSIHEPNHIERLTIVFDDQEATERVTSGYALTELNFLNRLMILPGFRYEYTNSEYIAKTGQVSGNYRNMGTITDTVATQTFGNFFPMIHFRYRLTDWMDIRAAYTETISKPNFSELLPREEISANSRWVRRGSPNLKPASSTNYDAFITFFGNKVGLISAGTFYKLIDDLIYPRIAIILNPEELGLDRQTLGYELYESINNPNETTVKGLELEWQSNLIYLPPPLNGLVLNVNYTRIWSETKYPQFEVVRTSEGIVGRDFYRTGPMINQPDYVFNFTLGYDVKKFSSRISLVYQGETLTGVGERQETDSFTENFLRLDGAVKYSVSDSFEVFGNVQNINNEPDQATQFTNQFYTFEQYYSWVAEAGIRIKL